MIIHNVTNFAGFFQTLDQCSDHVTLITPDGKSYDWSLNKAFLRSFFQTLDAKSCSRLELRLSGDQDASRLLCYLLEGECSDKAG